MQPPEPLRKLQGIRETEGLVDEKMSKRERERKGKMILDREKKERVDEWVA